MLGFAPRQRRDRMNPCTLGWYLPILVKDVPGALQPSDDGGTGSSKWTTDIQIFNPQPHSSRPAQRPAGDRNSDSNGHGLGDHGGAHAGLSTHPPITMGIGMDGSSSDDSERHNVRTSTSHPSEPAFGRSENSTGDSEEPASAQTGAATWKDLDAKFRRDLPDDAYVGRLVYRGLVMRACPAIRILDGVETSHKEREKAERILREMIAASRESTTKGQDKSRGIPPASAKLRIQ